MDAAVVFFFQEAFVGGEAHFPGMLNNEQSIGFQRVSLKDGVGNAVCLCHVVWRIGKDEIELFVTRFQIFEYVHAQRPQLVCLQFVPDGTDEVEVQRILFYEHDARASSRNQLESDASRSGKEVERAGLFPVQHVVENVEQAFASEIGCGSRFHVCWRIEPPGFEFSADYTHNCKRMSVGNVLSKLLRGILLAISTSSTFRISCRRISILILFPEMSPDRNRMSLF